MSLMEDVEQVARAMAAADGVAEDEPLEGYHSIVGQTIPVFKYDPHSAAWTYYVPLARLFIGASEVLKGRL